MAQRTGLLSRITNEGDFGPWMIVRALALAAGFLLSRGFERAGVFRVRGGRRVYYAIYALGKRLLDRDKVTLFSELLKPGAVFLDVGGAFGFFTALAARRVGVTGQVIAFEPDPTCAAFIDDVVDASAGAHIRVVRAAAWSEDTELTLHLCAENRGENSLFKSPIHDDVVVIPARSIDETLGPGTRVDVVKMDVQGAEDAAIRGMRRTIAANPHLVLVCECSPSDLALAGVSLEGFLATLAAAGLVTYRLDRSPMVRVRTAADLGDLSDRRYGQCDLLCRVAGGVSGAAR